MADAITARTRAAWIAVVAAALVVYLVVAMRDYRACRVRGGVLVRGALWFTCVAPPRLAP